VAAAWLNLAPDHLDWHASLDTYIAAKARLFDQQSDGDTAIGYLDDPIVAEHLARASGRSVGFALHHGDYRTEAGQLVSPFGQLIAIDQLARPLPHDQLNALAASAMIIEAGLLAPDDVAAGLATFVAPPHRIELIAEVDGIRWINDSKATTPHAALAALGSFESVVLIAGGRNKDVDLGVLAEARGRLRGLVAIGEDGDAILEVLAGVEPARRASSMGEAVEAAASMAKAGDVVLLSPACASFDWYPDGGYTARGEHFRQEVVRRIANRRSATEGITTTSEPQCTDAATRDKEPRQ
jgi:UDP-N-acetylmuramoylalanine--D-glutamate ligase